VTQQVLHYTQEKKQIVPSLLARVPVYFEQIVLSFVLYFW